MHCSLVRSLCRMEGQQPREEELGQDQTAPTRENGKKSKVVGLG